MNNQFDGAFSYDPYSPAGTPPPESGGAPNRPRCAADYRKQARAALSHRMGLAVCAHLLADIVTYIPVLIAYMLMFFFALFLGKEKNSDFPVSPLILIFMMLGLMVVAGILYSAVLVGKNKFCLGLVRKDSSVGVGTVFSGFRNGCFGKAIGVMFLQAALEFAVCIPLLAIFVPCLILMEKMGAFPTVISTLILLILYFASVFVMVVLVYQYRLSLYLLVDHPEMGVLELLRTSRNRMKGNKWRMFCLDISFIGWFLLAAYCSCGIGILFLAPYFNTAGAAFYNDLSVFSGDKIGPGNPPPQSPATPEIGPDDYFPGAF